MVPVSSIREQNMKVFQRDNGFVFHAVSDQQRWEYEYMMIPFEVPLAYLLFVIQQSTAGD